MKLRSLFITIIITLLAAGLVYAYMHSWIIITIGRTLSTHSTDQSNDIKKRVTFYFYKNEQLNHETNEILWVESNQTTLYYLVSSWLNVLEEEGILDKKITLQSALVSPSNHQLYLSFDQSPFSSQQTTRAKWLWIESLLKTIKESGIKIQSVQFLVQHQSLQDTHLDFSNAWPVDGFLK